MGLKGRDARLSSGALVACGVIGQREAQMMMARVLGVSRAVVIAHPERLLDEAQAQHVQQLFARRAAGEPIAYLLGTREFYGRDFRVSPATLIPRPETELLVELALRRFSDHMLSVSAVNAGSMQYAPSQTVRILDLGTGSGVIAITLALESPGTIVVAADISPDALTIAAENAARLNAQVALVESNWYANLAARRFDLIVANPPYIAYGDAHLSQGDLRFEPSLALTDQSGDGLDSIRAIVTGARDHLHPHGWLLFEHGYDQAPACRQLLLKAGFANLISMTDLAGISRVAGGQTR